MFSKLAVFFVAAATIVSALPGQPDDASTGAVFNTVTNKCNVGKLNCCKSVQNANPTDTQTLGGILGLAVGSVPIGVGVNCDPITVLAAATGSNCNAQPACCKGNNQNALGGVACSPINVPI